MPESWMINFLKRKFILVILYLKLDIPSLLRYQALEVKCTIGALDTLHSGKFLCARFRKYVCF